ncbi:glycerate kinase [Paenibacillus forsythiae]|uniref:Glycerate kinase n=1 Tax=Paenibacillus forsythiae TaxID=365616 RepID=A0ABU3H236_9BACL|nr:glycerate kinase [Paenibacillus forsythiae]MDT3424885.1 glycerate kinase [Paenibacillus forsythiae]
MRILIVPDSYKGSLSSKEVADCMEQGVLEAMPEAIVRKIPIADGGEGTVEAMISALNGEYRELEVVGPLGDPVTAVYGVYDKGRAAVIEMAAASGLTLVPKEKLNPMVTTTYGTGQLIKEALENGCRRLVIGIGGSATNDGGIGMAQALGVKFLDAGGEEIGFGGGELHRIATIDISGIHPGIAGCMATIASDVTNPLCGDRGASRVFGPQKGATPEMVEQLDSGLKHLAEIIREQLGIDIAEAAGAGAAGGLGAGLIAFLNADMAKGIDIVLEAARFDEMVQAADLVITGEGRTDAQTAFGKTPAGVAKLAKKYNKPVICVSGGVAADVRDLYSIGLDVVIGATQSPMTLDEAIHNAEANIRHAVASVIRAMRIPQKYGAPQ